MTRTSRAPVRGSSSGTRQGSQCCLYSAHEAPADSGIVSPPWFATGTAPFVGSPAGELETPNGWTPRACHDVDASRQSCKTAGGAGQVGRNTVSPVNNMKQIQIRWTRTRARLPAGKRAVRACGARSRAMAGDRSRVASDRSCLTRSSYAPVASWEAGAVIPGTTRYAESRRSPGPNQRASRRAE